ncbi:MAG: hypothetical protein A3C70_03050 [Candidatus Zambryskibacteria bacterium RIFCSPHIGHO2_02_FULL_43_14]|uniref:UDP-N-acetylmuramoyl-L-alanyl-D-glutamate--2,6-diaminopimelate ligase n=1 Tax=Candidatus Zambryskibacteria bacterium RIFCSPHIGHO2_02_FULL_43_14 TaxID=1802748 RepID=A0A1G2TF93_9BACT|nr:MAG: hypothetical protein A2829_00565 [Candidatus Zambryskibacteria bacterium RIFCSPHIGHO2_01_FULL_43_60]OHA95957.1 MAG: hypothetical protein A3C70_03050 [Candidatus Zambryskibacteria bacterium RIFCSPHIGHO2_02_FULL_43_14]OHB03651.1 MAG: hypothetical protein A3B03_02955 [Candidatus Zambryskibacteria bacterium RIFCSPLOWO2_01_FULL_42_41]
MKVKDLISGLDILEIVGDTLISVDQMTFDSRKVVSRSLFISAKGIEDDGHDYIEEAIKRGAKAVVHQNNVKKKANGITYVKVVDSRKAIGIIAQNFYSYPTRHLKLVGITGTNGKTTVATLLFKMFRILGYHTALISTVENRIDDKIYSTDHTTPDSITLTSFLKEAVVMGVEYAFMECSSHGIEEERIAGLEFVGGIFTNLTLDHLDYHGTFEKYAEVKKKFFDKLPENAFALANADDQKGDYVLSGTSAHKYFFSLNSSADFISVLKTKLIGRFNAYNVLAVYATAVLLGVPKDKVKKILSKLDPPPGRLELVKSKKGIYGVVDYAHTPNALENVLKTLKGLKEKNRLLITLIGCGGDRDKAKRPIIGEIAVTFSDYVIFTSDNPRTEDPDVILSDIVAGVPRGAKNYECISARAEAIQKACGMVHSGDIILVAGKGHETCQIFKDKTIHFSDLEELSRYLI